MLYSAGFFQQLPCPYIRGSGECVRPHCHFQHVPPEVPGEQSDDTSPSDLPAKTVGSPKEALGEPCFMYLPHYTQCCPIYRAHLMGSAMFFPYICVLGSFGLYGVLVDLSECFQQMCY